MSAPYVTLASNPLNLPRPRFLMTFAEAVEKDNIISCQRDYSKSVSIRHQHPEKDRLLAPAHRTFWKENGYAIIFNAVP